MPRIMYVCDSCRDNNPEGCGYDDREDLRIMPDGAWLCVDCIREIDPMDFGEVCTVNALLKMPSPPEFGPKSKSSDLEAEVADFKSTLDRCHRIMVEAARRFDKDEGEARMLEMIAANERLASENAKLRQAASLSELARIDGNSL